MKNRNHIIYYKKLKALFPKTDYEEGKFLREAKQQLNQYYMCNPSCTYVDIENTFGKVEDVVSDYIREQGSEQIYISVQKRKMKWLLFTFAILSIVTAVLVHTLFLGLSGPMSRFSTS